MIARTLALSALLAVGACAYPYSPHALPPVSQLAPPASGAPVAAATAQAAQRVPVILVSIDGFRPDYLELRNAETLASPAESSGEPLRLLVAAWLGKTRLIDNIAV